MDTPVIEEEVMDEHKQGPSQLNDMLMQNATLNQVSVNLSSATDRTKTYGSVLYESQKDGGEALYNAEQDEDQNQ